MDRGKGFFPIVADGRVVLVKLRTLAEPQPRQARKQAAYIQSQSTVHPRCGLQVSLPRLLFRDVRLPRDPQAAVPGPARAVEGGGGGGQAGPHVPRLVPGVGGHLHLPGLVVVRAGKELRPARDPRARKEVPLRFDVDFFFVLFRGTGYRQDGSGGERFAELGWRRDGEA